MKMTINLLNLVIFAIIVWAVASGLLFFWTKNVANHYRFIDTTSVEEFCKQKGGEAAWGTYEDYDDEIRPVLRCYFN